MGGFWLKDIVMSNDLVPLIWFGEMIEVGNLENEGGIGFSIKMKSGQIITVQGLTQAQASIASMYLYKAVEVRLSGAKNVD